MKNCYLALGDSMSIDKYTGVPGGGVVNQLVKRLQARDGDCWDLIDRTYDGCVMAGVPIIGWSQKTVELITITIGGNDILQNMNKDPLKYAPYSSKNTST